MYQGFAELYDGLMNDVDYESWADHYSRLLSIYGVRGGKVCECACGTGSLTLPLQRRGFQMTGVDLSREMLWQAAQKARKSGIAIPFVQQDMRALNLHKPVDAVLATCDGVNYLLTEEDLLSFFRAAKRSILPGGALVFDVSTPYKLKNVLCAGLMCEDREDVTYLWQNTWSERTKTVSLDLCFFIREADGRYRRSTEEFSEHIWQPAQIEALLHETGFTLLEVLDGDTYSEPVPETQRFLYIARASGGQQMPE